MTAIEQNGAAVWLVNVCKKWYTVELLREWIRRADGDGWPESQYTKHRESPGQRDRWARALAILEVAKR